MCGGYRDRLLRCGDLGPLNAPIALSRPASAGACARQRRITSVDCRSTNKAAVYLGYCFFGERGALLFAASLSCLSARMDSTSYEDKDAGLAGYAARSIGQAVAGVSAAAGGARPFLIGHSLGGTFAAISRPSIPAACVVSSYCRHRSRSRPAAVRSGIFSSPSRNYRCPRWIPYPIPCCRNSAPLRHPKPFFGRNCSLRSAA